jgi:uncharacterized protein (TIGR03066 family)
MKAKARNANNPAHQKQNPNSAKATTNAMPAPYRLLGLPRWAVILFVVASVAGASFAAFAFLLPGRIPPALVGRWRVVGGQMDGTIFEFQRNGTMIGRKTLDDKEGLIEGTAEAADRTLRTTTTNPFTRKAETGTQSILTLTENEFVTEDESGTRVTMVRVR